jgi:sugar/nucleoside kinase (ribokinase family)
MIPAAPDLLIVGCLTIDRFSDGSTMAGGSVLHGARALVAAGRRVATITVAGPEPEAAGAVAELTSLGWCLATPVEASIRFFIDEGGPRRRLVLEGAGAELTASTEDLAAVGSRAVLLAPIAAELSPPVIRACAGVPVRVAALQGWLRRLVRNEEARPLALDALGDELTAALADLDCLVASEEDLAAVAPDPRQQARELRALLGPGPLLAITVGAAGVWLDDAATGPRNVATTRRLTGRSTVGAGDAFTALLAAGLGNGLEPAAAADAAMTGTAHYLSTRLP